MNELRLLATTQDQSKSTETEKGGGGRFRDLVDLEAVEAKAMGIIRAIEQVPRCPREKNIPASISLNIFKQHVVVAVHKSRGVV